MSSAASFHPNEARRQLSEKRNYLMPLQLFAQCNLASRINPV
jgi:hypothetical protein